MAKPERPTSYEKWMAAEGLPIAKGHGVTDVRALELAPWKRLGGRGAFIQLIGMEGLTGLYLGEIPPGAALAPEKHMYEELVYIVSGSGACEVWNEQSGQSSQPNFFEWQAGSLFALPLNAPHRLINGAGGEPALFLGATNAPLVMDLYHNPEFVFGCGHRFADRYRGEENYFKIGPRRERPDGFGMIWETNFITDVRDASIDALERKGAGVRLTVYEIAGNVLVGHLAEWPVGRYHKAHYHGGGAILLIVRSVGYTLMWPPEAGPRPYESGNGAKVVKVDWREGSVLSPPSGWFHQHFNTGPEPARQLAIRYGSHKYGVGFHDVKLGEGALVSVKQGGTQIEYEDEDPEIRRQFSRAVAANGVECRMPKAV